MATFEPNVPKEQPADYVFWARPGGSVIADESKKIGLTQAGKSIDELAKTARKVNETNIEGDTARGVDKILDDWDKRLQPYYDAVTGQQKDFDVFSPVSGEQQAPANLNKQLAGFDKLDQVMASGKLSNVYVKNQVDLLAKDLRGQYPMNREDVDRKTNEVFARGIANKAIEAKQNVINSYLGQRDAAKNKIESQLWTAIQSGHEEAVLWLDQWKKGQLDEVGVASRIAKLDSVKAQIADIKAKRDLEKDNQEVLAIRGKQQLTLWSGNEEATFVQNMVTSLGFKDVNDMVGHLSNDTNMTQEHRDQIANAIMSYQQSFYRKMIAHMNEKSKDGRTLASDLGGYEEAEKHMPVFKQLAEYVQKGEYAPFKFTANQIRSRVEDTEKAFTDGSMGDDLLTGAALGKLAPANTKWAENFATLMVEKNLPDTLRTFIEKRKVQMATNSGSFNGEPLGDPNNPLTFQKVIEDTTKRLSQAGYSKDSKTASDAYAAEVNTVQTITDPKAPQEAKKNIAAAAFNPNNSLSVFNKDSIDPNGNHLTGQATIYSIMTTPNMDKEIMLKPQYSPEERQRYVDWKKNQFINVVFPTEVRALNEHGDDPDIHMGWNDKTHQLELKPMEDREMYQHGHSAFEIQTHERFYKEVNEATQRLNLGLANLANLAKYTKQDPNEFIAMTLAQNHGLRGPIMDKIVEGVTRTLGQQNDPGVQ